MEQLSQPNLISKKFHLRGPVISAPMGGGPTTPELVAAVCNAGGLGTLAGAYLNPPELKKELARVRELTARPFAVNLFAPMPKVQLEDEQVKAASAALDGYRSELDLEASTLQPPFHPNFDEQLAVIVQARPAAFSFVFGLISPEAMGKLKAAGIYVMGTATSLHEAQALEALGVDAVIAQGAEAGGHRAMFTADDPDPLIGTLALTRLITESVKCPVIASGGLMDGKAIALALQAGAQAAQLGTAFLATDEAGTSAPYRSALLDKHRPRNRTTRVFSGRWARGLENRMMKELDASHATLLPFPAQNALTRDVRVRAARLKRSEFLSLWCGAGVDQIRTGSAGRIVSELFLELGIN